MIVRYIYDTYGYPVSNLITSPLRADLIYIMMKPLEWIFLFVLYLLDLRPEQRIRNQYILQDENKEHTKTVLSDSYSKGNK